MTTMLSFVKGCDVIVDAVTASAKALLVWRPRHSRLLSWTRMTEGCWTLSATTCPMAVRYLHGRIDEDTRAAAEK